MLPVDMTQTKPNASPFPLAHPLYDEKVDINELERNEMSLKRNREVFGSLLFVCTRTRADIATSVSLLSMCECKPCMTHWKLLKNVVQCAKGAFHYGIYLHAQPKNTFSRPEVMHTGLPTVKSVVHVQGIS